MSSWIDTEQRLPDEKQEVWVRVRGDVRPRYYRIGERWYALVDLERWRMNTSPYWKHDRAWYVQTDDVQAWRPMDPGDD